MNEKQRNREAPTFANINLLGKCNVDCYFCLGKDIPQYLTKHNQLKMPFQDWKNFGKFLRDCKDNNIKRLYITGQNTDALLYRDLWGLITNLQAPDMGFEVGIRTNGYMFEKDIELIKTANLCKSSVGISIHTLDPETNAQIMGKNSYIPDWHFLLPLFHNLRISVVVNRYNWFEIEESLLANLAEYENIRYIQLRRVSTDTRYEELKLDIEAFDVLSAGIHGAYNPIGKFYDADVFRIKGKEVVLWPTVSTTIGSFNYFTDGTISKKYFVVEGYLEQNEMA